MQGLKEFSLPILGMKIGQYKFEFKLDEVFLSAFEDAPYQTCNVIVDLNLDKKENHLSLEFGLNGTIQMDCDRCSDLISFPINSQNEFLVKFDENEREEDEVLYINPDSSEFNCAQIFYESLIVGLPMVKTCDDVNEKQCNPEVIKYLYQQIEPNIPANPLSEALKNIKVN